MRRYDNDGLPKLDDCVVVCEKCKKIGPFEEMSPYTHGWFGYNRYKHKDCGGELNILVYDMPVGICNFFSDDWRIKSSEEKEKIIKEYWEQEARRKKTLSELYAKVENNPPVHFPADKYYDANLTCPVCGSHYIKKLTTADRAVSVAAWGLASGKIGKQYECKKCGHKW